MNGFDYCVQHFNRAPIALGKPGHIAIPLLEDHSAVQLVCTQVAHALANRELEPPIAHEILNACKIANSTLPRPPRMKASDKPEPTPETVSNFACDEWGNWIGPREAYRGPDAVFAPQWSVSKHMYECECERLGKPRPTCAADYPAHGWLTEDEMREDPDDFSARYEAEIAELKKHREAEEAHARAQGRDPRIRFQSANPSDETAQDETNSADPNPSLDLHAAAAPQAKRGIRVKPGVRRCSLRCPLSAARSPVVESVNTAKTHIPNGEKSVPPRKNTTSPANCRKKQREQPQATPHPLLQPNPNPLLRQPSEQLHIELIPMQRLFDAELP